MAMVVHTVERLTKGQKPVDIDLHINAIDFIADYAGNEEELQKKTCVAVMRNGVVLWLNISRPILRKMMQNAK